MYGTPIHSRLNVSPAESPVRVTLRALRGAKWAGWPAEVRLRLLAKVALRSFGVRASWTPERNRRKPKRLAPPPTLFD